MATLDYTQKIKTSTGEDILHPTTNWGQIEDKPSTYTPTAHTHVLADITDVSAGTLAEATAGVITAQRTWSPSILKQSIEALSDLNTNNYLTGVSGSGNGTVTFTRNGLSDLTWNASHNHDTVYVKEGGTSFSGVYPVVVRVSDRNFYSDADITFTGSTSTLAVTGNITVGGQSVVKDNDSRLTDARTPLSHTHGQITDDGKMGILSGVTAASGDRILISDSSNSDLIERGPTLGTSTTTYLRNDGSWATPYTHPSHPGDDIDVDTGVLTGSQVISDLDFNITTDTLGHVTDANGVETVRNLDAVRRQDGAYDLKFWKGTQASYDAIGTKDSNTLYIIVG